MHILWLGYHTGSPSSPRTCKAQSERNFSPWQRPQVSGDEMANARPANGGRLVLMCTLCSSKWRTSNGYPPTASPEKGPEPSVAEFGPHDGNTHWKENCGLWWTWRIPCLVSEHHCNALEFTLPKTSQYQNFRREVMVHCNRLQRNLTSAT